MSTCFVCLSAVSFPGISQNRSAIGTWNVRKTGGTWFSIKRQLETKNIIHYVFENFAKLCIMDIMSFCPVVMVYMPPLNALILDIGYVIREI